MIQLNRVLFIVALILGCHTAQAQITSTFDTDNDGWTALNAATGDPVYISTGGNPGGFIQASDGISGVTTYMVAPPKFSGNRISSYRQFIRFDLKVALASTVNGGGDVKIFGGGISLVRNISAPLPNTTTWTTYSLQIDETQGWRVGSTSGPIATNQQVKQVLSSVTAIHIGVEYSLVTGTTDKGSLDNVILEQRILPLPPAITSFTPASGKPGTTITIDGNNFDPTSTNNIVYFGSVTGTVTNASANQLTVTLPTGVLYGPITVINNATGLANRSDQPFTPTFDDGGRIIAASFDPKADLTLGAANATGLKLADLDGDGWNDIVVSESGNTISIFRNLGTGGDVTSASFAPKITLTGGGNQNGLFIADADGDGKLDIMTGYSDGFAMSFVSFRNTSSPASISFEAAELWPGLVYSGRLSGVIDVDGDGLADIIGQHGNGSAAPDFWIANNISSQGNIEFGLSVSFFGSATVDAGDGVNYGDLNNDGKPDMIIRYNFGGTFSIAQNTSTSGTISFGSPIVFSQSSYGEILISDFNLDGKNDIAWKQGFSNDDIYIRLNSDSDGVLTASDFTTQVILNTELSYTGSLSQADINGDGKPDILATDGAYFGVFENVYSGGIFNANAFVPAYLNGTIGASLFALAPAAADLNGDSKPDVVVSIASTNPKTVAIFENKNVRAPVISINTVSPLKGMVGSTVTITGNHFSETPTENIVMFGHVKATVTSATKTQLNVIVPAGASLAKVSVTRDRLTSTYHLPFIPTFSAGVNFNNTHFAPPISFTLTSAGYDVDAGDVNNDGKPDVIADVTVANAYAFRNTHGTGSISTTSLIPNDTLSSAPYPHLMDLDGDGTMDMLSGVGPFQNASAGAEINFNPYTYINPGGYYFNDFADFDLDGKIDFIGVNGSSVALIENRTTAGVFTSPTPLNTFGNAVSYSKPGTGGSVIAADFDNDGLPDFAATNPDTDNISLWRNSGAYRISTNQFIAQSVIAVGDNPTRIYTGDFNSDGKVDLLLIHGTGTTNTRITILENQSTVGSILFSSPVNLTNTSGLSVAHVADLDGDGKPEIITTSEAGNRFSIFKNIHATGALTLSSFAAPFNTIVTAPRALTTADINLDGKPEIILTRAAGLLVVYENLISLISPPTVSSFAPTSGSIGTTVVINGTDFSTTPANNIVYFGATKATVTSATSTQITVTVPAGATYQPISVTVSGLTAFSSKPFNVTFCSVPGISSSSFAAPVNFGTGASSGPVSMSVGDLDGDGKADLLVANRFANTVSILRNTSSAPGNISYATRIDLSTGSEPVSIMFGDLDGDGKGDLAVAIFGQSAVSVFRNTSSGPGTISFAPKIDFATGPAGAGPFSVALGDLDKDGKVDLAVANNLSNQATVLLNTSIGAGSISFAARVDTPSGAGAGPYSISIGDIDLDGKDDLVTSNANGNSVSVFLNLSSGVGNIGFDDRKNFPTGTTPRSVSIGDLDGDDKLDLVVTAENPDIVSIFRNTSNTGNISFATRQDFATDADPWRVAIGDLDGDGKADLVTANLIGANVSVLHNISTGIDNISFSGKVDFSAGGGFGLVAISIEDFDNDGKSDLVAAEFNGDVVSVLRNIIPTATPTITSFSPTSGSVGTFVTISGTNFNTPFPSGVNFNGVNAPILDYTSSSINVSVPTGATTGPIQVLGCNTVTSVSDFTIGSASITITTQPSDATVCAGTTATFSSAATGTTNIIYQWQFASSLTGVYADITNTGEYSDTNTNILSVNTSGNFGAGFYRCKVNGDAATTVFSSAVQLTLNAIPAAPTTTDEFSCGIGTVTLQAAGATNGKYRWYDVPTGGIALEGETNSSFTTPLLTSNLTYYVSINDGSCESTRTATNAFILLIPSKPSITSNQTISAGVVELCLNAITLSAPSGFAYTWTSGETTQQINNVQPGNYSVVVKDDSGCSSISSDVIQVVVNTSCVNNPPVINTTSVITTIGGFVSIDLSGLISDPDNNLDPASLQVVDNATQRGGKTTLSGFMLDINYSGNNFSGDDFITIRICDQLNVCIEKQFAIEVIGAINVYNGISPNGDGKNDTWIIEYVDLFPNKQYNLVTIYNRWGDVVWEDSGDYDNTSVVFTGLNKNGNELPTGSYFYKIDFFEDPKKTKRIETLTGYLSLKR